MIETEDRLRGYGDAVAHQPLGVPTPVDDLRARAKGRARRRALLAVPAVLGVIVAAASFVGLGRGGPERSVVSGPDGSSTETSDEPIGRVSITIDVPAAWSVVGSGRLYASEETTGRHLQSITVASTTYRVRSSRACDLPVAALDALGQGDVMISVREVPAGQATAGPRPPLDEFLDTAPVARHNSAMERCLANPAEIRIQVLGWTEADTHLLAYVATGSAPSEGKMAELREALESLAVTP